MALSSFIKLDMGQLQLQCGHVTQLLKTATVTVWLCYPVVEKQLQLQYVAMLLSCFKQLQLQYRHVTQLLITATVTISPCYSVVEYSYSYNVAMLLSC